VFGDSLKTYSKELEERCRGLTTVSDHVRMLAGLVREVVSSFMMAAGQQLTEDELRRLTWTEF
jgi:hypothetical protein